MGKMLSLMSTSGKLLLVIIMGKFCYDNCSFTKSIQTWMIVVNWFIYLFNIFFIFQVHLFNSILCEKFLFQIPDEYSIKCSKIVIFDCTHPTNFYLQNCIFSSESRYWILLFVNYNSIACCMFTYFFSLVNCDP